VGVVAANAVFVEDGLDERGVAEAAHAPFRRNQVLRLAGQHGGQQRTRAVLARLVAADAPLDLARHQVDEAPHPLDGPPLGVQGDEVERLPGRHAEAGRAVFGHVGESQHLPVIS